MDIKLDIKIPSLLSGMARVLDFGCTYDDFNFLESRSDYDAIKSDWQNVGFDLKSSIRKWNLDVR